MGPVFQMLCGSGLLSVPLCKLDLFGKWSRLHILHMGLHLWGKFEDGVLASLPGDSKAALLTASGEGNSQYTMWLYKQAVHVDFFNRLVCPQNVLHDLRLHSNVQIFGWTKNGRPPLFLSSIFEPHFYFVLDEIKKKISNINLAIINPAIF